MQEIYKCDKIFLIIQHRHEILVHDLSQKIFHIRIDKYRLIIGTAWNLSDPHFFQSFLHQICLIFESPQQVALG